MLPARKTLSALRALARVHRRCAPVALLCALLAGCGGGSGGGMAQTMPPADTGLMALTLTDAAGDFLSYTVDVTRIELHNVNGDTVQVLPLTTRVDFAQLANVSEFVGNATIPSGTYDRVDLVLDYSNAEIVVQDADGSPLPARAQDESGAALTTLTVQLQLANTDRVVITRGIQKSLALDFDLAASNTVTFNPAVVTVTPLLIASPTIDPGRVHRVRGVLDSVDTAASTIVMKVRPFDHNEPVDFGKLTVKVTDATTYAVNGTEFTGAPGLDAVGALAVNTGIVVEGTVAGQQLTASRVVAGSSVAGNGKDAAAGVVISRTGNTLMLSGAHEIDHDSGDHFRGSLQLLVGDATQVVSAFAPGTHLNVGAISVGQLVTARGIASTVNGVRQLDATAGAVRLEVSEAAGEVVSNDPLTLQLDYINGVRPGVFDFAGTGASTANDANAASYIVDTTGLETGGIAVGDVVRTRGVVNGFGLAPPDFNARSVIDIDLEDRAAELTVSWRRAGATKSPFESASATALVLDLTTAHTELHLRGINRAITSNDAVKTLVPSADGTGEFAIHTRGEQGVRLFTTFAAVVDAVQAELTFGKAMLGIAVNGKYNRANMQLTAHRIGFELVPASTGQ